MSSDGAGRAELVGPSSPSWSRALERLEHDVYHLPAYVEVEAARQGHRPAAFVFEDHGQLFLVPLLLQQIPGSERQDCASPYGYPGPLCSADAGDDFLAAASGAFATTLRSAGFVAAFVRLHPLLSPAPASLERQGTLIHHGDTAAVDLGLSEEEIWTGTRSGHRNEINRAKRQGFEVEVEVDQEWRHFDDFVRLYHRTMERVGADQSYFFPRGYFDQLRQQLAGRLSLAVVRQQDQVAAAGLFFETGGIVQYHLSGTADEFLRHNTTKLLLNGVRRWAQGRGNAWLHLGGGLGGRNDTLYRFKSGFTRRAFPFNSWRLVLDANAYAELVRARTPAADPEARDGFFPAYRSSG